MNKDIQKFNKKLSPEEKAICDLLMNEIDRNLSGAESKIWHAHPVWFLEGNPIVGYSKLKNCIRLLFGVVSHLKKQDCNPKEALRQLKHATPPSIKLTSKS